MPKFRKKPVVIDAFQWRGTNLSSAELLDWLEALGERSDSLELSDGKIMIHTLEGDMTVSPDDWIIRGIKGEYYPCKPDIFAATYDAEEA